MPGAACGRDTHRRHRSYQAPYPARYSTRSYQL